MRNDLQQLTRAGQQLLEMSRLLGKVEQEVLTHYRPKKEVVFLPWRAENWNAMETLWKAAMEDSDYAVTVLPLPWYYRSAQGSPKEAQLQYDAAAFPDYVPVTDYREYSLPGHHPDIIVMQNPYDQCNYTTMVDPQFWSGNLKKYCEHLIYVPWFLTDEIDAVAEPDSPAVYNMRYYVTVPGVVRADLVVVQSDLMRSSYIKVLTDMSGEDLRCRWEKKIRALGSPLQEAQSAPGGYDALPASPIWQGIKDILFAPGGEQRDDH